MISTDLNKLDYGQGPIQHQGQHFVTVPVWDQVM